MHVQTDDVNVVQRAVEKALPRFGRSAGTSVTGPRNGWVAVHDELLDREPAVIPKLGKELSYAAGGVVLAIGVESGAVVRYALFDRGGAVDEYASVPEYYGPLPPGDVVALGANPTVLARLTGADPARVRAVIRTAVVAGRPAARDGARRGDRRRARHRGGGARLGGGRVTPACRFWPMSEPDFPRVVDAAWLAEHLGDAGCRRRRRARPERAHPRAHSGLAPARARLAAAGRRRGDGA